MDLTSRQNIQLLLKKHGLKPLKRFGQNFLIDKDLPQKLAATGEIDAKDTVLEIGPGIGAITHALAQKAKRVIAVEKDRNMVEILKETLQDFRNVRVIEKDALKIENCDLIENCKLEIGHYKVVGNLPFYLTAPVIRMFLEMREARPQSLTLVVQKEVGQRICAKPPEMSILANSVQFYATPEMISFVSKKSFWPQPEVDAVIIKITPKPQLARTVLANLFFKIMKAGFSHPRKQLLNNLSRGLKMSRGDVENWLIKNNIRPTQRAKTLSVEDWMRLTNHLVSNSIETEPFIVFKNRKND